MWLQQVIRSLLFGHWWHDIFCRIKTPSVLNSQHLFSLFVDENKLSCLKSSSVAFSLSWSQIQSAPKRWSAVFPNYPQCPFLLKGPAKLVPGGILLKTTGQRKILFSSQVVMPSANVQNILTMEKQKSFGESSTFICTICGDGFSQYTNVLTHMSIHGPLESFTFDGSSNGFEVPREYVLQENGTLTVVNDLTQTHSTTKRPASPGILPSHLPFPENPVASTLMPQSSNKDVFKPKPLDCNLDKARHGFYRCEVCSRSFNSLQSLHFHQQYRNTERGHKCTLCCKLFGGRPELKQHLQNHTFERFHCCACCGKRFVKADALNVHMKQNHPSPKPFGISEHNQDIKLEKTYSCKKCRLNFFWMTDFQTHSLYHCKGKEVDTVFETEVEIEVPSKATEDRQLETCNGTSVNDRNLDIKVFSNTSNEIESSLRPYRCGLCGVRFQNLTALKVHHKTHQTQEEIDQLTQESLKPFKNMIPKGSRRRRSNHLNVKLHSCKHCSRVFHHSSSLSRHMRYHKGTMHTCVFCGRHFQQRCDVTRHIIMFHKAEMEKKQGLRDYSQIDDQTNSPDNENTSPEDQSTKAARGNHKCQECGKKFGLLCVYQRHLRYHKKEPSKCSAECTNSSSEYQQQPGSGEADETGSGGPVFEKVYTEDIEEDNNRDVPNNKENFFEVLYKCTECTQTFSCMEMCVQHQASHCSENRG